MVFFIFLLILLKVGHICVFLLHHKYIIYIFFTFSFLKNTTTVRTKYEFVLIFYKNKDITFRKLIITVCVYINSLPPPVSILTQFIDSFFHLFSFFSVSYYYFSCRCSFYFYFYYYYLLFQQ